MQTYAKRCYGAAMNAKLKQILSRAENWPDDMQEEALQSLLLIEEEHSGVYPTSDAEWAGCSKALLR